jgi:hypothetical protein
MREKKYRGRADSTRNKERAIAVCIFEPITAYTVPVGGTVVASHCIYA